MEGSKKHTATGFPQEGSNLPGFKQIKPGKLAINGKPPKEPNTSKAVTAIKIKNTLFFITGRAPWPITYLQQKHPKGNGINTVNFHIQLCFPYPPPAPATLNILEGAGQ